MIVRLCDTKGAYEALPEKEMKVNLKELKKKFTVLIETPILVIIKDSFEVSVFKNGRLLIKDCKLQERAEEQAKKVYEVLEKA